MALTPDEKIGILFVAKEAWIRAEAAAYAYERRLRSSKQTSDLLKILTIFSALVTSASSFYTVAVHNAGATTQTSTSDPTDFTWVTVFAALLTAGLATVERMYSPAEDYQKYWSCRSELDGAKQNVVCLSITLNAFANVREGIEPFNQIGQKITEIINRMPFDYTNTDQDEARRAFQGQAIAGMILRIEQEIGAVGPVDESVASELPEDAPDVVPAFRQRVAA